PSLNPPKGGGSLRSIDEKFEVNAATGTASLSIPVVTTPARNNMTPTLSLAYDSGSGNGCFGIGWSLSLPSITRRTSKGVPRYEVGELEQDGEDVFLFSGVEDLVPKLAPITEDKSDCVFLDRLSADGQFLIRQYAPRTEGSFLRIERWSHKIDPTSVHWRTISRSNVTSIYGFSANSRISDPFDVRRTFRWLIAVTYDGRGNSIIYNYKPDDDVGINVNLATESHRSIKTRATNRYIKSILYGNKVPSIDQSGTVILPEIEKRDGTFVIQKEDWMFEVVFDYGDHANDVPTSSPNGQWNARKDAFSSYTSGFEIRTTRLCSRVLMFHHMKDELGFDDCLVSSTELSYDESPVVSYLAKVTQSGFRPEMSQQSSQSAPIKYFRKAYPPIEFNYSELKIANGNANVQIRDVDKESMENLPIGLSSAYDWIDLDGEGKPCVVYASQDGWYRKRNFSNFLGGYNSPTPSSSISSTPPLTSPHTSLSPFLDLDGNGSMDIMISGSDDIDIEPGFWRRTEEGGWTEFCTFPQFPSGLNLQDPNVRLLDLTGDGRVDIIISEGEDSFLWYPGLGTAGYGEAKRTTRKEVDPGSSASDRIVFSNDQEAIYFTDFTGDGLRDLVRVRNGDISYWPNIGYGHFGTKVTMENSPWMGTLDEFSYSRLRLADIDGSGCSDLLYFPPNGGLQIWMNEAGNSFSSEPVEVPFPQIDSLSSLKVADLFGNGTNSLVWSTSAPGLPEVMRFRYAEFNGGLKPHLLKRFIKGTIETRLEYKPSSQFYQDDKLHGIPWATKLPFPVQCLSSVGTFDHVSGNYNFSQYTYHHGFYDGAESEFRGFGMVEMVEREYFFSAKPSCGSQSFPGRIECLKNVFSTPAVQSKKWYHTGAYFEAEKVKEAFRKQYYSDDSLTRFGVPISLRSPVMDGDMTSEDSRQAWRSLKGSCLREEIYQLDGSPNQAIPFAINDYSYGTRVLQHSSTKNPLNRPGVFHVITREHLSIQLDRKTTDHRIGHGMVLETDSFGNETKRIDIKYGREKTATTVLHSADDTTIQTTNLVLYTAQDFTNAVDTASTHLAPLPAHSSEFQIHGIEPLGQGLFSDSDFGTQISPGNFKLKGMPWRDYTDDTLTPCLRMIGARQARYRSDDLSKNLPLGTVEPMAILAQGYTLAITPDVFHSCYQGDQNGLLLQDITVLTQQGPVGGGYIDLESNKRFWIPSGTQRFMSNPAATPAEELAAARASFFTPVLFTDPFGQSQTVDFDDNFLLPTRIVDALENTTSASYDYINIQPTLITDANGNREAFAYDELGSCVYRAAMGNPGAKITGDSLDLSKLSRSKEEVQELLADPVSRMSEFLGKATSCTFFGFPTQTTNGSWSPGYQISVQRDTHINAVEQAKGSNLQLSISYFDGNGRRIQTKQYSEANTDGKEWIGDYTVLTKSGAVSTEFLPTYEASHVFSRPGGTIPATTTFYDAMGRVAATLNPDVTWSKTIYGPWDKVVWDEGDTIELDPLQDVDVGLYFALLCDIVSLSTSWLSKMGSSKDSFDQVAAAQSLVYSNTPTEIWLDVLGNDYCTILDNGNDEKSSTRRFFDIQKHLKKVVDSKDRIVSVFDYDMLGNLIHSSSMDSGQKWLLNDVSGQQLFAWDSRGTRESQSYDVLRRPCKTFVNSGTDNEYLSQQIVYGESQPEPEKNNLRGKVYQTFDQASKVTNLEYDYAGHPTHIQRQFVKEYKRGVDWAGAAPIEMEEQIFESMATFDALQRSVSATRYDGSVSTNVFNRQGLLKAVRGLIDTAQETTFVKDVQYNASNQQISAVYGNGSKCQMTYDPLTLRMTSKKTIRDDRTVLQNLQYTRDCTGNTTHIDDASEQELFFRGTIVKPTQDFTYDALYRLSSATGREHLGQMGQNQVPVPSSSLSGLSSVASPADAKAVASYTERYTYDSENNILSMAHCLSDASVPGWTRTFTYEEPSLLEPEKKSNRLTSTSVGDTVSIYSYAGAPGANGLMSSMAGFEILEWDVYNQLSATSTQHVNPNSSQAPEMTYYRYDGSGNRVRKVTERSADADAIPRKLKDHLYMEPGCEVFLTFTGDGTTPKKKIQTTHFFALELRIASLETSTFPSSSPDQIPKQPLTRYYLTDHNSSISLTLDTKSQILTQEEYSPYGSTMLCASHGNVEKKYRYSGKELDNETGLYYFGKRYLMAWIGRWVNPDPIGILDGCNVWCFCGANPVGRRDADG
ncbi:SpvB-domain-containing protein, partial [Lepidopterella palustris CBS 459.81]